MKYSMTDKYADVIIPMTIVRRFECTLEETKDKVVALFKANPNYSVRALFSPSTPFSRYLRNQ